MSVTKVRERDVLVSGTVVLASPQPFTLVISDVLGPLNVVFEESSAPGPAGGPRMSASLQGRTLTLTGYHTNMVGDGATLPIGHQDGSSVELTLVAMRAGGGQLVVSYTALIG